MFHNAIHPVLQDVYWQYRLSKLLYNVTHLADEKKLIGAIAKLPICTHVNLLATDLEVANIDTVKSNESCIQTDVRLGEGGASEVALTGEDLLHSIESSEHLPHCLVVGLLLGGKSSTVHSIVDIPNNVMNFTL